MKNVLGFSALHYAAYYKDDEAYLAPLLDAGCSINERDSYGWTALAATAEYDHIRSATILLNNGADFNTRDKDGWTPLLRAVSSNSHNVLQLLLERGASPLIASFRNETILHFAASKGDFETMRILTQVSMEGLNSNAENEKGETAMEMMRMRIPKLPQLVIAFESLIEWVEIRKVSAEEESHVAHV